MEKGELSRAPCLLLLAFVIGLPLCRAEDAPKPGPEPPHGIASWLDPATAPFIPIPEIDTSPHEGLTVGLIPLVLSTNSREEIARIIAPDIIYSQYFGWGSRFRVFGYPSNDVQWSLEGGGKQRVEREFDGRYAAGQDRSGPWTWWTELIYDRSGTARFFGIGNETPKSAETTYVNEQARFDVLIGRNLTHALQLAYTARLHDVDVEPGVLHGVPSIETRYAEVGGVGHTHELHQLLMLTYDTRDFAAIPRHGARYLIYVGATSRALLSSVSYTDVGLDTRYYWPLAERVTLAWHAGLRYMPSAGSAPFWALSSLGGNRSVPTERDVLRSYGEDRYIDRNMFATGVELRSRLMGLKAFGTQLTLEATPYLDAGKVFADTGQSPVSHLHLAGGFGIRAVASPFVVGYVDIGYGPDGATVFSGIDYPF